MIDGCLLCDNGYYLQLDICQRISINIACTSGCQVCVGPSDCLLCNDYNYIGNQCDILYNTCSFVSYLNTSQSKCELCNTVQMGCITCTKRNNCTFCEFGYALELGICNRIFLHRVPNWMQILYNINHMSALL